MTNSHAAASIGRRLHSQRDVLSTLPEGIVYALELAHAMQFDLLCNNQSGRPEGWTQRSLDGVLLCALEAARQVQTLIEDALGEEDAQ